jgi:myo-inositol 2-dehydrogenase/D-chiro-inositol 1-dehydrogenase
VAGEIGNPEMLVVTSRDPGAPPVEYLKRSGGIFRDMLIHDFDVFRWILDDDAVHPLRDRQRADRSRRRHRRRRRFHGGDDTYEARPPGADQYQPTRCVWLRSALRSAGQQRACCRRATTSRPKSSRPRQRASARTSPSISSSNAIAPQYALEMAHFFDAVANGKPVRTSIEDGVKALELADAATTSWREQRIVEL